MRANSPLVLVVDDDPLFRAIITRVLRDRVVITEAHDGHDAYEIARRSRPDLVILDLNMPVWDGVQTLRAFRSDAELRSVPVLITSGSLDCDLFYEACELGVSGIVSKADVCDAAFPKLVEKTLRDTSDRPEQQLNTSVESLITLLREDVPETLQSN